MFILEKKCNVQHRILDTEQPTRVYINHHRAYMTKWL